MRDELGFGGPGLRHDVVVPADERRQRHQDRLDPAVGLESEQGAAVVDQIELRIAAATPELPRSLGLAERQRAAAFGNREVGRDERSAELLDELEDLLD